MWWFVYWMGYGAFAGVILTLAGQAFANQYRVGRHERPGQK